MRPALIVTIAVTVVLGLVALFAGKDIWKMMQFGAKEATAVRMEAVADGVLTETVSAPGIVEPMRKVDVSAFTAQATEANGTFLFPVTDFASEIGPIMDATMDSIMLGEKPAADALKAANDEVNALFQ
jgi:ABC-type glycerol-3-phosphate transport system substrate-binding protein